VTAADEELHGVDLRTSSVKKRFSTPGMVEALTLEDYKRLTANLDRNLTDEPIQKRRGTANRHQITATTFGDFI
jgi:hypothetical protein